MFRFFLAFIFTLGLLFCAYVALRLQYVLHNDVVLDPAVVAALRIHGDQAIASGDVPVAAVLLHGGRPIGAGHNTVLRDGNAGGHAEINAVSDAMHQLGSERFRALDRDSLVMVSTFEPCAMCRGMLVEYRIGSVVFNEPKTLRHWIRDDLRWVEYEWSKRDGGPKGLQDSLFRAHPAYDAER